MSESTPKTAPFGSWQSPITSAAIVTESVGLDQPAIAGSTVYWIENRASEQGRSVLVRSDASGARRDLTPPGFSVRSRVHEYGGAAMVIDGDVVYFSNHADQQLYRQSGTDLPQQLTHDAGLRYADMVIDHRRQRLICVREDHRHVGTVGDSDDSTEAINAIVAIDLASAQQTVLAQGADFYASPRLSPDGKSLAWICWHHPNMPWDGTALWRAALADDGALLETRQVAGAEDDPIFQPSWSPSNVLHFVSERSGWWNLYRLHNDAVQALAPMTAEFGRPLWNLGMSTYGFDDADHIICSYAHDGVWQLGRLDPESGALEPITTPFRKISDVRVAGQKAVFIGGGPAHADAVVELDLTDLSLKVLRRAIALEIDSAYLSIPQTIDFPTTGERDAHAFFYAPANPDFCAPTGQLPPLLVLNHGGPTSAASATLNLMIQFWTSRGFAVVDVNYGGSTGYGRAYRQRLKGNWGIVDVDDAINAARSLVARGAADPARLAIRGGSAGGYTALAALTFHDVFKGGASYYGVSDLETLARDCHKFESRYLDSLIGPYPQRQDIYQARSPIHFTNRLTSPLILFQGMLDKVVPPAQAQLMFDAVCAKGLPVAYLQFAQEAHGFRRSETIQQTLEAELYFYGKIFGFVPADMLTPVKIFNLDL